jgi:2,5-diamino-6-(ribosylamino)-4(3H)-pyrimidinone 5'-phosphate reductase
MVRGRGWAWWVRWQHTGGGGMDLLVLVCRATPQRYLAYLRRSAIPYLVAGDDRVDLLGVLRRMADRLGVSCVVSKAGGGLNGALLRAGLVDEVQMILLPALIGGRETATSFDGSQLRDDELPTSLRLISTQTTADGAVWLRYEVDRR